MRRLALSLLAVALLALVAPAAANAARPLAIGFLDGGIRGRRAGALAVARRAPSRSGSDIVRIDVGWVAGTQARQTRATPPIPRTTSRRADAAIADAASRGLRVLASFTGAPRWAEGAGSAGERRHRVAGSPIRRRSRATAPPSRGATRGRFPDPARPGRSLPRVSAFQPWNEPNLDKYLAPQWSGGKTFAPAHYRRMLTAFTKGVKSVRASAVVVTAGTAPFGDPFPDGHRIMPARFVREMLCLRRVRGKLRRTARCPSPGAL